MELSMNQIGHELNTYGTKQCNLIGLANMNKYINNIK
jgi:hypothetical protein